MVDLAVLTCSYAQDFELCLDLHRSVLSCADESVRHYIVVPARDMPLFSRLQGPRTVLWEERALLAGRFVPVPWSNVYVNLRHPVPPVRGWIVQQIIKLAAAARIEARVLLLADSDCLFIRRLAPGMFLRGDSVRFYRKDGAVDGRMPRHVAWHAAARRMLGLPPADPPYPDYVSSVIAWDPRLVAAMQRRIEQVGGRPWAETVSAQLHFSEWTLYGVYLDSDLSPAGARDAAASTSRCHSYWDTDTLDGTGAAAFLRGVADDDFAIMISAKSRTPLDVRRASLEAWLREIGMPQADPSSTR
jgi:hypothetical protein